jgi:signal transduction histidine kinase
VAVAGWLLVMPVALSALRLVLPSDHLPLQPPDGVHRALILGPSRPVGGISPGDSLVAINGRPAAVVLASPRSRPVRAGDQLTYTVNHDGVDRVVPVTVQSHPAVADYLPPPSAAGNVIVDLALVALSLWLLRRRPDDRAVHALVLLGAALFVANALPFPFFEPLDLWARPALVAAAFAALGAYMVTGLSILLFACSFPTPIRGFARHPWTATAALPVAGFTMLGVLLASGHGSTGQFNASGLVAERFWEATAGLGLAIVALRWLRSRADPLARRRMALVAFGYGITFGASLLGKFIPAIGSLPNWSYFAAVVFFLAALVVAIVKDDLFELNVVLNRGLVALSCAAVLLGVYLAAVAITVAATGASGPLVALPAAGAVAVIFAPVRSGVQSLIGRRLFGTGSDPRLVFHRLASRLSAADDPESLMAAVVETASESLRLPFAAVELRTGEDWQTVEQRGRRPDAVETFDLAAGDTVVGRLVVAPRRDVKILSPSDRQLLHDLAAQSGVAARVAALLAELRGAQQRLLIAREAERDRIHCDLHDSIGPALVGLTLQLEVAAELAQGGQLAGLVERLHHEAARTTEDIRRLVRELRPADLEELGLPAAVATAAARLRTPNGPAFDLDTPVRLPELSKQAEDAAYKICLEAMSNAVRHSQAAHCTVRLNPSGTDILEIEIADDGRGIACHDLAGTGLRSMHERAASVGGWLRIVSAPADGTRILAELPTKTAQ